MNDIGLYRVFRVLEGITQDGTGFYRVLLGFTGFHWFLVLFLLLYHSPGRFYWVLLGFNGFYWVLLGLTRFYWV